MPDSRINRVKGVEGPRSANCEKACARGGLQASGGENRRGAWDDARLMEILGLWYHRLGWVRRTSMPPASFRWCRSQLSIQVGIASIAAGSVQTRDGFRALAWLYVYNG